MGSEMLTICFDAVCDNCSNNINVMYMNNYFGAPTRKYIQYYIGDNIDDNDKSYFHDCYQLVCPNCGVILSDYSLVVKNGQLVDVIKTADKRKKKLNDYENIEEGLIRNNLYTEYCKKLLGVEYISEYSFEDVLEIKPGDKLKLMQKEFSVLERYEVLDITDDSDRIHKIIGSRRILYKVRCEDNIRLAMFAYHSKIDRLMVLLYENDIRSTDNYTDDFDYYPLRTNDLILPLEREVFSKQVIEVCTPAEEMRTEMLKPEKLPSDRDIATLIYNEIYPFGVRRQYLKKMMDITKGSILKEQILERLKYDDEAFSLFKNNNEGYIYALVSHLFNDYEGEVIGYFKDSISAHIYMKDWIKTKREIYEADGRFKDGRFDFQENNVLYEINKYQIIDNTQNVIKPRIIYSGFMETDKSKRVKETEYCGDPVSSFSFNEEGRILYYHSYETSLDKCIELESASPERFEYSFIFFPVIFKNGDKVRICGTNLVGRVNIGRNKTIEEYYQSVREGLYADYSDTFLRVDYKNGNHEHICPIRLEKV